MYVCMYGVDACMVCMYTFVALGIFGYEVALYVELRYFSLYALLHRFSRPFHGLTGCSTVYLRFVRGYKP